MGGIFFIQEKYLELDIGKVLPLLILQTQFLNMWLNFVSAQTCLALSIKLTYKKEEKKRRFDLCTLSAIKIKVTLKVSDIFYSLRVNY